MSTYRSHPFIFFSSVFHTTVQTLTQFFSHHVLNLLRSRCWPPQHLALTWRVSDIWPCADAVLVIDVHQRGPQSHHSFPLAHPAGVQVCRSLKKNKKKSICQSNTGSSLLAKQAPRNMGSFSREMCRHAPQKVSLRRHKGPASWPACFHSKKMQNVHQKAES